MAETETYAVSDRRSPSSRGRRIGRVLTKMGLITRDQVHEGLDIQKKRKMPLGQILIELGYVNKDHVNIALAAQAGIEVGELGEESIADDVIATLPAEMAQAYQIIPVAYDREANRLKVAMKSADNFRALDDLRLLMGFNVEAMVVPGEQLDKALTKYYGEDEDSLAALVSELGQADTTDLTAEAGGDTSIDLDSLIAAAEDNKLKRLLNLVLLQAIKDRASDIHFEPFEDEFKMRYRIDGVLHEMIPPPKHLALPIVSRVKVMANLDIAERRMPQDGRIELTVNGQPVDLRVAVLAHHVRRVGGHARARPLRRQPRPRKGRHARRRPPRLPPAHPQAQRHRHRHRPHRLGQDHHPLRRSQRAQQPTEKICTAEDPVEYDIDGLVQVQVNPEIGLTFAKALRSFLRQDPDIILVGETRDLETAQIGVQASLTGHLVFTTLHTNDAPSSIARLLDLGLESVPPHRHARGHRRPAPRPQDLPTLQGVLRAHRGRARPAPAHPRGPRRQAALPRRRLRLLQRLGLQGPPGHLRDHGPRRRAPRDDHAKRLHPGPRPRRPQARRTLAPESGLLALYDGITTLDEVVRNTIVEEA